MDFYELLKKLFGRQEENPYAAGVQRTIDSSFVRDTLLPLAGGPTGIRLRTLPLGVNGFTNPTTRNISVDPQQATDYGEQMAGRGTITHEIGHVVDLRNSIPEFDAIADRYYRFARDHGARTEQLRDNPTQFKAELFRFAVETLKTAENVRDPSAAWETLLHNIRASEGDVPGIGAAVFAILDHPMYRAHPINAVRQQSKVTPVRGPSAF
jgi:hypothetical protein